MEKIIEFEIPRELIENKMQQRSWLSPTDFLSYYFTGISYESRYKITSTGFKFMFSKDLFREELHEGTKFLISPNNKFILQATKEGYEFKTQ